MSIRELYFTLSISCLIDSGVSLFCDINDTENRGEREKVAEYEIRAIETPAADKDKTKYASAYMLVSLCL